LCADNSRASRVKAWPAPRRDEQRHRHKPMKLSAPLPPTVCVDLLAVWPPRTKH
jgi:hypothetical protein